MRSRELSSVLMALALVATACGGTVGGSTHDTDASTPDSPVAKEAGKQHDARATDVDVCATSQPACPASFNPSKACSTADPPCETPVCPLARRTPTA